jgi:uncharacterized SAM-binding protein YcdF (DUF218 family)
MGSFRITPRIVRDEELAGATAGELLDVIRAVTMILSLPRPGAVDALAVLSGQGEQWRLTHAIRLWEDSPAVGHLLVANGNPAESSYVELTVDYLRGLGLRRVGGVRVQAQPAPNTGLQAAWIAEQVAGGIGGLALVVSAYHLPRAYLTVLKALLDRGIRVPVLPVPVAVAPDAPVPETGADAYDLIPGEVQRILAYVKQGWVASPQQLRDYLRWFWRTGIAG